MENNNSSQENQENIVVDEIIKNTDTETEIIQPSNIKREKTQKIVKNSTAIVLTVIEIITTILACGLCLYLTVSTMTGNHAWSIILYFGFFAIILGVAFIYALISNITILVLMLTTKKPRQKGVIISYIINCLTILLYVPTIILMILAIKQIIL